MLGESKETHRLASQGGIVLAQRMACCELVGIQEIYLLLIVSILERDFETFFCPMSVRIHFSVKIHGFLEKS